MKSYAKDYLRNTWPQLLILAVVALAWSFGLIDTTSAGGAAPLLLGSISFNAIPIDIRTPGHYIEFDNTRAVQGLPAVHQKILVLGQRLAAGTVAAGVPKRILSAAQAEEYFGRGSMLHQMLTALKKANSYTECWAIALDDNGAGVFPLLI